MKGFRVAKRRLSDVLTADRRAELARSMAERVLLAAEIRLRDGRERGRLGCTRATTAGAG